MRRRLALLPSIVLAIMLLAVPAARGSSVQNAPLAAPPTTMTYQGLLRANGAPATGSFTLQFKLYNVPTGGSALYTETDNVTATNGLFTVILGQSTPLPPSLFQPGGPLYLGITVGADPELTPRTPLTTEPFAFLAGSADSATSFSGNLAGDVTGAQSSTSVTALRGTALAATAPTSGQVLRYNGTQWAPDSPTSANTANTLVARDASGAFAASAITANVVQSTAGQALELQLNGQRGLRLEPTTGCGAAACSPNVIGGFSGNSVTAGAFGAVIAGGGSSSTSVTDGPNQVTGSYGAVVGGTANTAGSLGTVLGGQRNTASGVNSIAAGESSTASGQDSIAMGNTSSATGDRTVALGSGTASGVGAIAAGSGAQATNDDSVALGPSSIASGLVSAVIGPSTASGDFATAIGLQDRATGNFSVALGKNADTNNHQGSIVISDGSQPFPFTCSPTPSSPQSICAQANNEVRIRGAGGIRLRTSIEASDIAGANSNTGCDLPAGSGTFSCSSSRDLKTDLGPIDPRAILEALDSLPIQTWRFKGEEPALRHIGPVAEDFAAAFPLGQDDKSIATGDEQGVALAAIQALSQIVREQNAALARGEAEKDAIIDAQAERIASLEEQVAALRAEQAAREQALEARLAALEQAGRN